MKKFAVIGACNEKYGDFLINHWLKSLLKNIDTKIVDIIILDYGLSEKQKKALKLQKIKIVDCTKNKEIIYSARFKDLRRFLEKNNYQQVISSDCGDVIFQAEITKLFYKFPKDIRVVVEEVNNPVLKNNIKKSAINKDLKKELKKLFKKNGMIYAGFIISPRKKLIDLCKFIEKNTQGKPLFGLDLFLVNIFLYRHGFKKLHPRYDFVPGMSLMKFKIANGVFLDSDNKPIEVVHNAGGKDSVRLIKNFGYGKEFNKIKPLHYIFMNTLKKLKILKAYK
jgi:hypothetical protein